MEDTLQKIKFKYDQKNILKAIYLELPERFFYSAKLMNIFKKDYSKINKISPSNAVSKSEILNKVTVDSFASFEGVIEELLKDYFVECHNEVQKKFIDLNYIYKKEINFDKVFNIWNNKNFFKKKMSIYSTYDNIFNQISLLKYFIIKKQKNTFKKEVSKIWENSPSSIEPQSIKYFEDIIKKCYEQRNIVVHTHFFKEKKVDVLFTKDYNNLNLMLIFLFFIISVEKTLHEIKYLNKKNNNHNEKFIWKIDLFNFEIEEKENKFEYLKNF